MGAEQGPEPTTWEVMRGLDLLRAEVEKIGSRVVSIDVYNVDKIAHSDRTGRAESRIRDLEQNAVESEKLKRQQRLTISLAVASPFIGAAAVWLMAGGLIR